MNGRRRRKRRCVAKVIFRGRRMISASSRPTRRGAVPYRERLLVSTECVVAVRSLGRSKPRLPFPATTTITAETFHVEVPAHLVVAAVFKTVGLYVNRATGGFDSHALPPFYSASHRTQSHRLA